MKILFTVLLLVSFISVNVRASDTEPLLNTYVEIAAAFAADDLETAREFSRRLSSLAERTGRTDLSKQASGVAEAPDIGDAREKFKMVSAIVVPMAKGKDGYYIMNCPMTENGDWVQNDPQVANPYFGEMMLQCGSIIEK